MSGEQARRLPQAHYRGAPRGPNRASDQDMGKVETHKVKDLAHPPVKAMCVLTLPEGWSWSVEALAASEPYQHDAFGARALGKGACWLWGLLLATPRPSAFLAEVTGMDRRTAERKLSRLGEHGLALKVGSGWARLERDLDEVARELGTAGKAERRRDQHRSQREGWGQYVERQRRRGRDPRARSSAAKALQDHGIQPKGGRRWGACVACPYQGEGRPRPNDGLTACPKCRRVIVFDADGWRRHAPAGKPMPASLRRTA
jgi:hypothetical protein